MMKRGIRENWMIFHELDLSKIFIKELSEYKIKFWQDMLYLKIKIELANIRRKKLPFFHAFQ